MNPPTRTRVSTTTDANGAFVFRDLPPAEYQFVARLPGFRTLTEIITLAEGEVRQTSLVLPVGGLTESVVVQCPGVVAQRPRVSERVFASYRSRSTSRLLEVGRVAQFAGQTVPVRIGGQIKAPNRIKSVPPRCPMGATGPGPVIILEGVVGLDGLVRDLVVLRPQVTDERQAEYVKSALDAARQWEYTPTLLNNTPTVVTLTITVRFGPI